MSRSTEKRSDDVIEAIDECQRYLRVLSDAPEIAQMATDAIERNLQIIGEALYHLPSDITDAHPEIA